MKLNYSRLKRRIIMKLLICLIAFCFILSGCDIAEDEVNGELRNLDSNIIFEVKEQHEANHLISDPEIYLLMETEKEYECFNFSITSSLQITGNIIDVMIQGIYVPVVCLTAIGPATGRIKLDIPDGTYRLIIRSSAFADEYNLIISSSSVRIEEIISVNTKMEHSLYHRYPEKSFVYLCGTTLEDTALCRMFIDTVTSVVSISQFEFPESGVIPYPLMSQGYQYNMPAKYFYYENESDYDRIEAIIKAFKDTYIRDKQGIGLSTTNWRNKLFYSWGM
jgi:hypothetical protein